ncbi:glycosyltransferase family 4 protein [Vallicoccus soli]|uniref:Glycosyltransferase family 1 protein n=1 Tax=Vallicoccus soli TaxID=2339232 RepID=A0A3A3Z593_9ACTN|nr:glycosyltransferase family 4 protein [Vallicoccus soli]RJK96888.1 glycosyltransferase family 1 protein [Vallicoccus soli]
MPQPTRARARRTLVVTNDFPPRQGGIQSFVAALLERLPPERVVVYASRSEGDAAHDAALPYPVHRDRSRVLLPTPRVARRAQRLLREEGCDSVLFGASVPLGLLAPGLRRAGARRLVALTHGHETWWARVPGARAALRRVGAGTDALTYLGEWTRSQIAPALAPADAARMVRLPPGVDVDRFRPGAGGAAVRARLGVPGDRPVAVCVSRLTPRKGQDVLVRAWPEVLRRVPGALLLLVGGGSDRPRLERMVRDGGLEGDVLLAGPAPEGELPAWYDAGDVFAMPCRDRRRGLEREGLGMVFLEASATGLPVVVGDSGGARDALLDGRTGVLVDGRDAAAVARAVGDLLADPARARAMGGRGRAWTEEQWRWEGLVARLDALLDPQAEVETRSRPEVEGEGAAGADSPSATSRSTPESQNWL